MFATSFLEQSRRDKILVTPHKRRRSAVWGSRGGDHRARRASNPAQGEAPVWGTEIGN